MTKRLLERTVGLLLAMAIAANALLIVRVLAARQEFRAVSASFERAAGGAARPDFTPFARTGRALAPERSGVGFAVRYASSRCPFSQNDPQWKLVATELQELGLKVIVLLPGPHDEFQEDQVIPRHAQQASYVNADWIRRYPLTMTPTLLIFDSRNQLIWHRQGVLSRAASHAAIQAVMRSRPRP